MSLNASPAAGAKDRPLAGILHMVAAACAIAGIDVLSKLVVGAMPVAQMLALRAGFVVLMLLPFFRGAGGFALFRTRHVPIHLVRIACQFVAMLSFFAALQHLPIAMVVALGFSSPIFVTALSQPILGEKVHASSEKLAEKVLPASSHRSAVSLVTRERVLCPEQFLRGDESLLSSAGGRDPGSPAGDEVKGGDRDDGSRRRRARRTSSSTLGDLSTDSALPDLRSVAMLHLKASQRYPTHEYAFALLHDCLTSATLAHDDRLASGEGRLAADARREYGSIAMQILWARGVHTQGYHWNT